MLSTQGFLEAWLSPQLQAPRRLPKLFKPKYLPGRTSQCNNNRHADPDSRPARLRHIAGFLRHEQRNIRTLNQVSVQPVHDTGKRCPPDAGQMFGFNDNSAGRSSEQHIGDAGVC